MDEQPGRPEPPARPAARGREQPQHRQAPAGEPTLLVWDEVITLFHEFGHALHGLFSDVRYPSQSGTEVPRDFVEYPRRSTRCGPGSPRSSRPTRSTTSRASPCRRVGGDHAGLAPVQRGLRDHRVPRGRAARPGLAPAEP
ncbi:M3 family metallopeptidase [Oerskovia sp. M15]